MNRNEGSPNLSPSMTIGEYIDSKHAETGESKRKLFRALRYGSKVRTGVTTTPKKLRYAKRRKAAAMAAASRKANR